MRPLASNDVKTDKADVFAAELAAIAKVAGQAAKNSTPLGGECPSGELPAAAQPAIWLAGAMTYAGHLVRAHIEDWAAMMPTPIVAYHRRLFILAAGCACSASPRHAPCASWR